MVKYLKDILMKREAVLFDAPLFILKSFIAILLGFLLFNKNPLLGKDMISLLLGLMLALQPVNVSGLKSGRDQIIASLIGGGITAVVVLTGGVNFITVPLAVALTLYITLRIDWRNMSVIAIFTSIYMTQFIQLTSTGEPSMYLTFRLRMLSLGTGILIAVIMNFLFSLVFYKGMIRKRTIFVIEKLIEIISDFITDSKEDNNRNSDILEKKIIVLFGDIDYIVGGLMDIKKKRTKDGETSLFVKKLKELRDINHLLLDLVMQSEDIKPDSSVINEISSIKENLEFLNVSINNKTLLNWTPSDFPTTNKNIARIQKSLRKISVLLN